VRSFPTADPLGPGWSAVLAVAGPDGHKSSVPFRAPSLLVGRVRPADLALPDPVVSARHCEFAVEDGWFLVRDLDSGNGTFVNGQRIGATGARLRDGDVVQVGQTAITVVLQGEVQGARRSAVDRVRRWWPWLAALAVLAGAGAWAWLEHQQRLAEQAKLRARWATAVREQLQLPACAKGQQQAFEELGARIGGRPVPIAAPGQRLQGRDLQAGAELLALYKEKSQLLRTALSQLSEELQRERDGLERIGRMGGRLAEQDRKLSFWAQSQLTERAAKGEGLRQGLSQLAKETERFAQLVEAVSVNGDPTQAPQLAAFRFSADERDLLQKCEGQAARAASGALGALNALDDE
jgi:pSer/pThr/pTyr-binding forkhead associated (FHA) protein